MVSRPSLGRFVGVAAAAGRLGWVMLRGTAEILERGDEHDRAQAQLRTRYPQYRTMKLDDLPVIALHIARATSWGDLSAA